MNQRADYDFESIADVDKYLLLQEKTVFNSFLDKQLNQPGIFFEGNLDKKSVTVHVATDSSAKIPEKLIYKSSLGKISEIEVVKRLSPGIKTLGIPLFPSSQIANKTPYNNATGTLGYFVKAKNSDKIFILTCYHVVWNGHDWDRFSTNGRELVTHPLKGRTIGKISVAVKNSTIDAALIDPQDISIRSSINEIGMVTTSRKLEPNDLNSEVRMRGNTSGNREGYIADLSTNDVFINYPDGSVQTLSNLILIKTTDNKPFCRQGDSGALLVDGYDNAIGISTVWKISTLTGF